MSWFDLHRTLARAERGEPLSQAEVEGLLGISDRAGVEELFAFARQVRERHFGNRVFLYGFVYFSTYCRNDCAYCFYRASNRVSVRYRKSISEVVETASLLAASGVHLIDLTMGEDPLFHSAGGFSQLVELVEMVKEATGLPIMVSPGVVPRDVLRRLAEAGADWYACYQETHNEVLFSRLRLAQDYHMRLRAKRQAKEAGLLIEEGVMVGVGETAADLAASFKVMRDLGAQQVRVMSFVPQEGTPMAHWPSPDRLREMVAIATLRILFPDRLIPASLDVDGLAGLGARLEAGANVVTSLIPPRVGLAGVARACLNIDEGYRTPAMAAVVLRRMGLQPASLDDYLRWLEGAKAELAKQEVAALG